MPTEEKPSVKQRVNMFDSIAESRRQQIIKENSHVADDYIATQPQSKNTKAKVIDLLSSKEKIEKKTCNYYIEKRIDDFFIELGKITKRSKSEVMNELLIILIGESSIMQDISDKNPDIKKLIDDFKK